MMIRNERKCAENYDYSIKAWNPLKWTQKQTLPFEEVMKAEKRLIFIIFHLMKLKILFRLYKPDLINFLINILVLTLCNLK